MGGGCTRQPREEAGAASPEAALNAGWQHYAEGAFDAALTDFSQVAASGPVDRRQAALYAQGIVWALRRPGADPVRAGRSYRAALALDTRSDLAPWCLLALARQQHLDSPAAKDLPSARAAYESVVAAFPAHPAAEEAFLLQQSTWLIDRRADDARRALTALTGFIEDHPHTALAASAWDLIARAQDIAGDPTARLAASVRALETSEADPANPRTDRAATLWGLAAQAEFDVGDFATARRLLQRLLTEYPTDDRGYGARLALARMDAVETRLRAGASAEDVARELDPAGAAMSRP